MSLGRACLIYAGALLVFIALVWLCAATRFVPGGLVVLAYVVIGVGLNRWVLRTLVEWHPMHNTLANVASTRLGMVLWWPLRWPVLFFQLAVDRHL